MISLTCFSQVEDDLLQPVQHFISMNQQGLHLLNQAYIVLIPKKSCPQRISEYMLISLTQFC
jgi:hypothetical protein